MKLNRVIESLDYLIIDNIIQERNEFQHDVQEFIEGLEKIGVYEDSDNINDLLPENIEQDKPWDRIDRILKDFGLSIRVDRVNLNAGLGFRRLIPANKPAKSSEATLEMKDLSSGEKVIFALALWTWGNSKGQKTDVLIVDEFDAHLNPSIAEKFISTIKKYFVDLGVQVIMTTHNPSTVAFAKNAKADIIWMEDGIINPEMTYESIIRELSNGLIDINHLTEETQLLIEYRERCIIYTEGKTDRRHIKSAIVALDRQNDFENHYVFGCTGADTIPFFISLYTGQGRRIALLDSDTKGKEVRDKMMGNPI